MSHTKQAVSAVLAVLLTLTALASVRPGVALSDEGHANETTTTSAPEESTTTTAPAPVAEQGTDEATGQDHVAETPADSGVQARTAPAPRVSRRDPRWINFSKCPAGFWTCAIAKMHQDKGRYMWRNGKVFVTTDGRRVRGNRGHTWNAYRRQARQLVSFLKALERAERVQNRRDVLVRRWSGVARCESGGRWALASGNGYYGGLQFNLGTWRAYGGRGYPHQQPAWHQAEVADRLRTRSGLHHWPHCGRYYG
jgi:hypothetical protein